MNLPVLSIVFFLYCSNALRLEYGSPEGIHIFQRDFVDNVEDIGSAYGTIDNTYEAEARSGHSGRARRDLETDTDDDDDDDDEEPEIDPSDESLGRNFTLRPTKYHGCYDELPIVYDDYRKAVAKLRRFCRVGRYTPKTTVYVSVVGNATAFMCSKWGTAKPCSKYEWEWAERAMDHECGKDREAWVKMKNWPKIFGRATLNQTICPSVTHNHFRVWSYRIEPDPVWLDFKKENEFVDTNLGGREP